MYVPRRDVFANLLRGRKSSVSLQDLFVRARSPHTVGKEEQEEQDDDDEDNDDKDDDDEDDDDEEDEEDDDDE